jgi:hypothetical protein
MGLFSIFWCERRISRAAALPGWLAAAFTKACGVPASAYQFRRTSFGLAAFTRFAVRFGNW